MLLCLLSLAVASRGQIISPPPLGSGACADVGSPFTLSHPDYQNGCVDRSNVRIAYVDHGGFGDVFWALPRAGAQRAVNALGVTATIQTTKVFDLTAKKSLIDSIISSSNPPDALLLSVPDADLVRSSILNATAKGITVYTLNSGLDAFQSLGAVHHVGQDEFIAGQKACERFQTSFNATNVLIVDVESGQNAGVNKRRTGCQFVLGMNHTHVLNVSKNQIDVMREAITQALTDHAEIDAILGLGPSAEPAVSTVTKTAPFVSRSFAIGYFDVSDTILSGIESGAVSFTINQQPYLQGFLPMVLAVIQKSTSNTLRPDLRDNLQRALLSGPAFVDTPAKAKLVECSLSDVHYCGDDDFSEMPSSCSCVDRTKFKIHFVHHGTSQSPFWAVVENGARQAAEDINISITISSPPLSDMSYLVTLLNNIWQSIGDVTNTTRPRVGLVTTIPTRPILLAVQNITAKHAPAIVINSGYSWLTQSGGAMYIGQLEENAGYEAARALLVDHINPNLSYTGLNDSVIPVVLCLDESMGTDQSMVERCRGVSRYLSSQGQANLSWIEIQQTGIGAARRAVAAEVQRIAASLNVNSSASAKRLEIRGLIATGPTSCVVASGIASANSTISVGCFDVDNTKLSLLSAHAIAFVVDQQHWLQGYLSVILMANKLFNGNFPANSRLLTGPTLLRRADIPMKRCENRRDDIDSSETFVGWQVCPRDLQPRVYRPETWPTARNVSGIVIIICWVLVAAMACGSAAGVLLNRGEPQISSAQPVWMGVMCFGAIVLMTGPTCGLGNPSIITCNLPWVIWCLGFTIFFGAYVLRIWRVVAVLTAGIRLVQIRVYNKDVAMRLGVYLLIDVVILTLAMIFSPFRVLTKTTTNITQTERGLLSNETQLVSCHLSDLSPPWVAIIFYKFIFILYGVNLVWRMRGVRQYMNRIRRVKLGDSLQVGLGVYIWLVSFVVFVFTLFIGTNENSIVLGFLSVLTVFCIASVMVLVVIGKLLIVYGCHLEEWWCCWFLTGLCVKLGGDSDQHLGSVSASAATEHGSEDDVVVLQAKFLIDQLSEMIVPSTPLSAIKRLIPEAEGLVHRMHLAKKGLSQSRHGELVEMPSNMRLTFRKSDKLMTEDMARALSNDMDTDQDIVAVESTED